VPQLSELLSADAVAPVIYGIVVDTDNVLPPTGLKEAGILTNLPNGEIEDNVLDLVISYTLAGVQVTLEIPASAPVSSATHLVSMAASISVSLSLLPPEDTSDEAFDAFVARVEDFARAYLGRAQFTKFIVPVTSYLEYLFIEVLNPEAAKSFAPSDPYILERFASVVTPERSDALKARLKAVFHETFGGEEGFQSFSKALFGAIYDRLEETCIEEAERLRQEGSRPQTETPAPEDVA